MRAQSFWLLASFSTLLAIRVLASSDALITGMVIGERYRPVGGATVQVVPNGMEKPCETTTAADGTFSLSCVATGRYAVRASFGQLRPWEIEDVELGPGRSVYLNFMLLPVGATASGALPSSVTDETGFWTRRVPNPVLATWNGSAITLRILAIVVAAVSFVLGASTMMWLGRRFGMEKRRLSEGEVGDLLLNPHMPAAGERVSPVAVVGARGASANVSYGVEEIAAALAAHRYGLVLVALVIAPGLFASFSIALLTAILVGQDVYLLFAMLLVPAGFIATPIVIGIGAYKQLRQKR